MSEVSVSLEEMTRKNQTVMLQMFASMTGAEVADRLGVSEATVSRFKSEETERCAKYLAALNLKVVPLTAREFDEDLLEALLTLARRQLASVTAAAELARFCRKERGAS
jgi:transcriptional regulator with XRE-family HTH domain